MKAIGSTVTRLAICFVRQTSRHIPYAHTNHRNNFRCDSNMQAYGYTTSHHLSQFYLNTKSTKQRRQCIRWKHNEALDVSFPK